VRISSCAACGWMRLKEGFCDVMDGGVVGAMKQNVLTQKKIG